MSRDHYRPGEPLDARGLFQLVTEEVLRDGVVDPREEAALLELSRHLALRHDQASAIFERSRAKFETGTLGPPRPLDRLGLGCRVLEFIFSDYRYEMDEESLFTALRKALRISEPEYVQLMKQAFPRPGKRT